jgi:hypothetical protein
MTLGSFFGGIALIALGLSLVIKTEWYFSMFGNIQWADEHLGLDGGSRLFYKLLGVLVCFFGILTLTGQFGGFFMSTAGQLLVPNQNP